ncbi:uncharacterized protein GIQ15_03609 [Arthroderma uncinatum]|uniref:uncharacterized protein n=1 Tax=Arthroderma uncinatum TaxID=74035 RepID=UPI00144A966A|nr:uncharacterized protein GIQ15_03609 [Arthroderma uncinatum]KAF3484285.1 hypothetical protein GIQ15_03609 [Arthroderma uncinatum]
MDTSNESQPGFIYCIISPLIIVFNILTFGLFSIVYRYNTLYVTRFRFDTGGLFFPRAINQLFTGIYVMEVCLIGLFFLIRDETGGVACKGQGICMTIALILTVLFQYSLNKAFGPLSLYLPITLEDEATERDKEFARTQDCRLRHTEGRSGEENIDSIELCVRRKELPRPQFNHVASQTKTPKLIPRANRPSNVGSPSIHPLTTIPDSKSIPQNPGRDAEAQVLATHEASQTWFSGIDDELEDLTPDERNLLVQRAFRHEALRARRPAIWIPQDNIGVSYDEILRTQRLTKHIWISNEYQTLDIKCQPIFSRPPPDFSEVDLIQL